MTLRDRQPGRPPRAGPRRLSKSTADQDVRRRMASNCRGRRETRERIRGAAKAQEDCRSPHQPPTGMIDPQDRRRFESSRSLCLVDARRKSQTARDPEFLPDRRMRVPRPVRIVTTTTPARRRVGEPPDHRRLFRECLTAGRRAEQRTEYRQDDRRVALRVGPESRGAAPSPPCSCVAK